MGRAERHYLVSALGTLVPGAHIEGTGTVVVVDVVESKWWVVRVLAEYGKKQVWGGRALNKGQIWA